MSPRALKRLASAFVLLALCWVGWTLWQGRSKVRLLWPQARSVARLSVRGAVLVRSSDTWRLESPFAFPADAQGVEALLEKLSKVRVSEPLSENAARHSLFGVTESSAIHVAGPGLDILVGSPGADWDSFFLRRAGEDAVLEAQGLSRSELDKAPAQWADRVLFALDPNLTPEIEVKGRDRRVVLKPGTGGPVLAALSRLEADSIRPDSEMHPFVLKGLKGPELRVTVSYAQRGSTEAPEARFTLECGPRKPEFDHPCRKKGVDGFVYELKPHRLQAFYDALKPQRD